MGDGRHRVVIDIMPARTSALPAIHRAAFAVAGYAALGTSATVIMLIVGSKVFENGHDGPMPALIVAAAMGCFAFLSGATTAAWCRHRLATGLRATARRGDRLVTRYLASRGEVRLRPAEAGGLNRWRD